MSDSVKGTISTVFEPAGVKVIARFVIPEIEYIFRGSVEGTDESFGDIEAVLRYDNISQLSDKRVFRGYLTHPGRVEIWFDNGVAIQGPTIPDFIGIEVTGHGEWSTRSTTGVIDPR